MIILSRPDNERCGGGGWCGELVVVDAAVVMVEGKRDGDGGGVGWGGVVVALEVVERWWQQ